MLQQTTHLNPFSTGQKQSKARHWKKQSAYKPAAEIQIWLKNIEIRHWLTNGLPRPTRAGGAA
ncbi:hypothetical protein J9253_06040 [Thiothrix litoralis]|uniref:Uncharacterized protein n=1 Tax=Thiothrix litoralis TaxID=2891210 RepID=A0ABX7WYM9_9GAMM|nr:hypothetical protein [Thiothrix litoralis]QTR47493.1 hypothetical protein J9253_06040 [Thiothrix litoralis]